MNTRWIDLHLLRFLAGRRWLLVLQSFMLSLCVCVQLMIGRLDGACCLALLLGLALFPDYGQTFRVLSLLPVTRRRRGVTILAWETGMPLAIFCAVAVTFAAVLGFMKHSPGWLSWMIVLSLAWAGFGLCAAGVLSPTGSKKLNVLSRNSHPLRDSLSLCGANAVFFIWALMLTNRLSRPQPLV